MSQGGTLPLRDRNSLRGAVSDRFDVSRCILRVTTTSRKTRGWGDASRAQEDAMTSVAKGSNKNQGVLH